MDISDGVLDGSRRSLRLAEESTDERVAAELNLLTVRLLLAAARDAKLMVEPSSVLISKCAFW